MGGVLLLELPSPEATASPCLMGESTLMPSHTGSKPSLGSSPLFNVPRRQGYCQRGTVRGPPTHKGDVGTLLVAAGKRQFSLV